MIIVDPTSEKKMLNAAIILAVNKFAGKKDKGGEPYILHLLWVMQKQTTLRRMIVGVLHDLFEDTLTTMDDLLDMRFPMDICLAILALTKWKGETRMEAAVRAAANDLAIWVKLADVEHNLDISRIKKVKPKHLEMMAEYKEVHAYLLQEIEKRVQIARRQECELCQ